MKVRKLERNDWPATWAILEPVIRQGETYSFAADMSEAEAEHAWVETPEVTFVAENDSGEVLGTYFLRPNQPGQGDHVCNCGYVVAESARGQGVASKMCEHSQAEAMKRGYRAMQYNLVVATNSGAVRLWQKHGFEIIGTLPEAFRHPTKGYVDAHVMYKRLKS